MPQYSLINDKMLTVQLANEEVFAKKGSMIAYKGNVTFAPSTLGSEGMGGAAMRGVTGEGLQLMSVRGSGEVLYARHGMHITLIQLQGEMFFVESGNVLAFDGRLRTGTMFLGNQGVQGFVRGAMSGQGLFTTTLEGYGEFAMLSDGNAIGLDVTPNRPICVDPQAYIGHRGQLNSQVVTDVSWKTFVGQGSGESFQLKFTGQGTVYIQASER
ncbi:MAG TPA: AIM24 family protein [Blastocatellia bacterium]|nr:AIM24 family protein [Blastocatellia bacterium]